MVVDYFEIANELDDLADELKKSYVNENIALYNGYIAENIIYYGAPGTGKSYGVSE